jgi:3-hydroxyacyl-CoA dehydrogenase
MMAAAAAETTASAQRVALVGAGLIGRAWAMVFARASLQVAIWDAVAGVAEAAMDAIGARLADLHEAGLIAEAPAAVAAQIAPAASLEAALAGVVHVQEQGPERVEVKRELFARLDALCPAEVVLASSTSGIPASAFTEGLAGRARCLVAHPVNPPYLVPLVELVGAPWTDPAVVARTRALMERIGQVPVTAFKETRGFVLNRLQAALVAEAFRMVRDGVMSVEDVDRCVKDGLGLRWSFMGPSETIDLNAPGGVADYVARFGPLMGGITQEQTPYDYDAPTVGLVTGERRAALPLERIEERSAWRDRRLMALVRHKRGQPG